MASGGTPSVTAGRDLRFDRGVPKELVHKRAVEQVFMTDSAQMADDRFACAAHLPRAHALFNDTTTPLYDLTLLVEVVRQSAELIAHRHLGVARDRAFVFRSIALDIEDTGALRVGPDPSELVLDMTVASRRYAADELVALELSGTLELDGRRCAAGTGSCLFLDPRDYLEMRHLGAEDERPVATDRALERVAPEKAGRRDPRNVVLREGPRDDGVRRFQVVADERHPTFFDHAADHVPGMVLLEACRQAALATAADTIDTPAAPTGCSGSFSSFAGLEDPLTCTAVPPAPLQQAGESVHPPVEIELRLEQGGRELARPTMRLAFLDDVGPHA